MINWTRVAELQDDLGAEDFAEITELFMQEVETCLTQLATTDETPFSDQMHYLKGCLLNLGFSTMQEMCAALELSGDKSQIPQLAATYQASKEAFTNGMAQKLAS